MANGRVSDPTNRSDIDTFLYVWTDKKYNKLYVGKYKGSEHSNYICSSKIMLKEYKLRPQDFTRRVLAHGNNKDITVLETKILTSVNAAESDDFYNLTNGGGKFICRGHTEETKKKMSKTWKVKHAKGEGNQSPEKISAAHTGKKHTEETKKRMSKMRKGRKGYRKGMKNSDDHNRKMRETCLERYGVENPFSSEEIRQKSRQTMLERYGVDHNSKMPGRIPYIRTDEQRRKISEARRGKPTTLGRKRFYNLEGKIKLLRPEESIPPGWYTFVELKTIKEGNN